MISDQIWRSSAAMFLTVTLAAVALVLLFQWWGVYRRERDVRRSFRSLTDPLSGTSDPSSAILQPTRRYSQLDVLLSRLPRASDMAALLRQGDIKLELGGFFGLSLGLGIAAGLASSVVARSWFPPLLLGFFAGMLPTMVALRKRTRRLKAIEEQLPEAIDLLGRAIRAGHPLSMGLRMVGDESPEPIAAQFRRVAEEQRFGMPFEDSLLSLVDRVPLVDVRILTTAMMIQHEVGGNLAETLDNIAKTIRSRFTLRRQLRVYTAQGRMSGYILAALPPAVGTVIYMLDPTYIRLLFTEPMGRFMLAAAVVLQICGFLWIRRIISIEV